MTLQAQLGYFGMAAQFSTWDQPLPDSASVAPLLLLDMSSLPEAEWTQQNPGIAATVCNGAADLSRGALRFRTAATSPARRLR